MHCLAHAVAAVAAAAEAGRPVMLLSAASAAGYAGPAWFAALVAEAKRTNPEAEVLPALDCGDRAGHALAALRHGLPGIRYNGPARERVRSVARSSGATLFDERPESLDLADFDANRPNVCREACLQWLSA